ncbi:MAG: BatD family protein [bacterium]
MRYVVWMFALCLWPALVWAQSGGESVTATVRPEVVELGKPFRYDVTMSTFGSGDLGLKSAPGFGELEVLGRTEAPQFITVNNVSQRILTVSWTLRANALGSFEITPPKVRLGDALDSPSRVTVKVVKPGKVPKSVRQKSDQAFIETSIAPTEQVYIGQQVNLSYDLYTDARIFNPQLTGATDPPLDDFWIENLNERQVGQRQATPFNGRLMEKTTLRNYAIFPLHTGKVTIDPMQVTLATGGFLRSSKEIEVASDPIELTVLALPPNAPPGFYSGNVGQWDIDASVDSRVGKVGELLALKVQVSGAGDVNRIRLPDVEIPDARVAVPQEDTKKSLRGNLVTGKRVGTWSVMPTKPGKLVIPAIAFTYFDPTATEYRTKQTAPIEITVADGVLPPEAADVAPLASNAKATTATEMIAEQVQTLGRPTAQHWTNQRTGVSIPMQLAIIVLAIVLLGLLAEPPVRRWRARREPAQRFNQRLHEGRAAIQAAKTAEEVAVSLKATLGEILNLPNGRTSGSAVRRALKDVELPQDDIDKILGTLEDLETSRFAPASAQAPIDAIRARALSVLDTVKSPALLALLRTLALALLVLGGVEARAQSTPTELFDAGDYVKAAQAWEQQAEASKFSDPSSVYNAGIAFAHAGDWGRARAYLERAHYLSPRNGVIESELDTVRGIVRLGAIESTRVGRVIDGTDDLVAWNTAAQVPPWVIPTSVVLLLISTIALFYLSRRKPLVVHARVALLVTCIGFGVWWAQRQVLEDTHVVVLLSGTTPFHEGPSDLAATRRVRGTTAGTMLRAIELRPGWTRVVLTNEEDTAWVPSSSVFVVTQPAG